MDEIYIVAPGRSIASKVGIIKAGTEITAKICGSNFNKLISIGWIIKKENLKFKHSIEESQINKAKVEVPIIEEKKPVIKKGKKKKEKIGFGAVKVEEKIENEQIIEDKPEGGPIESITIKGRRFAVDNESDMELNLGGFTVEEKIENEQIIEDKPEEDSEEKF